LGLILRGFCFGSPEYRQPRAPSFCALVRPSFISRLNTGINFQKQINPEPADKPE
jgi:hypothetical protein